VQVDKLKPQLASPSINRRALAQSTGLFLAATLLSADAQAQSAPPAPSDDTPARLKALIPELEAYFQSGMRAFDVPGAVLGLIADGRPIYARGFGVRQKGASDPVTPATVFQIGSATKAFLATALAIAVDRNRLKWDDRIVDLDPSFALLDPWVTREFRVFDLVAQRSGLPPYANDQLGGLGYDASWLMRSLRFVEPTTSFRSTFTYTNITHIFGGKIAAAALGAKDWPDLATREFAQPLAMNPSFTAQAIAATADHATGHRWTPNGSVAIPFTEEFPYLFGPAGDINAGLQDCLQWLRLQLGNGMLDGRLLVSIENLHVTRMSRVAISETSAYAMGWIITQMPNGRVIWHNGGTLGFGAHIGFLPDHNVGIAILSNQANTGFHDAVAMWAYGRLLGSPPSDPVSAAVEKARKQHQADVSRFTPPASAAQPPSFTALTGNYHSNVLGKAALADDSGKLVLTLHETAAQFILHPFDGAVFTLSLNPKGRFSVIAASAGNLPAGFANFQAGNDGLLTRLELSLENQPFLLVRT
jgi:CubicO group peptidase (beta-lactamase class C family)